jgi:hypothetical protein
MTKEKESTQSGYDAETLLKHAHRWLPVVEAGAKALMSSKDNAPPRPAPPPKPAQEQKEPLTGWPAYVAATLSAAAVLSMLIAFGAFVVQEWTQNAHAYHADPFATSLSVAPGFGSNAAPGVNDSSRTAPSLASQDVSPKESCSKVDKLEIRDASGAVTRTESHEEPAPCASQPEESSTGKSQVDGSRVAAGAVWMGVTLLTHLLD